MTKALEARLIKKYNVKAQEKYKTTIKKLTYLSIRFSRGFLRRLHLERRSGKTHWDDNTVSWELRYYRDYGKWPKDLHKIGVVFYHLRWHFKYTKSWLKYYQTNKWLRHIPFFLILIQPTIPIGLVLNLPWKRFSRWNQRQYCEPLYLFLKKPLFCLRYWEHPLEITQKLKMEDYSQMNIETEENDPYFLIKEELTEEWVHRVIARSLNLE